MTSHDKQTLPPASHAESQEQETAPSSGGAPAPRPRVRGTRRSIALAPRMTTSTAFLVIARACSADFAANLAHTREAVGEERIHQLRVALRRCRAAISLFGDAIVKTRRAAISDKLRRFQQELGGAREWDVFIGQNLFGRDGGPGNAGAERLLGVARERRETAYQRAISAVSTSAAAALPRRLDAWIAGEVRLEPAIPTSDLPTPDPSEPVIAYAARRLRKLRRKIVKLGSDLEGLDPERLHNMRIAVKKIHYAADFFLTLWEDGATQDYIAMLKSFQDALGRANDYAVARVLIGELAKEAGPSAAEAVREMEARTVWREAPVRCRIAELSAQFAKAKPFWNDTAIGG